MNPEFQKRGVSGHKLKIMEIPTHVQRRHEHNHKSSPAESTTI